MKTLTILFLSVVLCSLAGATNVTITADPGAGFVNLVVNGQNYQALDYTGNYYLNTVPETWNANLFTANDITVDPVYYGPSDPNHQLANYTTVYDEDIYLFEELTNTVNPSSAEINGIQNAVYYLSGASGYTTNSYVTAAQNNIATNCFLGICPQLGNLSDIVIVDSPLYLTGNKINPDPIQGFIYETACATCALNPVPEPNTLSYMLFGGGLLMIGLMRFGKNRTSRRD